MSARRRADAKSCKLRAAGAPLAARAGLAPARKWPGARGAVPKLRPQRQLITDIRWLQIGRFEFKTFKPAEGIEYVVAHPEIGYPLAAVTAVTALPPLRRLLYRMTIGRLRSPEVG